MRIGMKDLVAGPDYYTPWLAARDAWSAVAAQPDSRERRAAWRRMCDAQYNFAPPVRGPRRDAPYPVA